MIGVYRFDAADAGQYHLTAPAESGGGVRYQPAHGNFQVAGHELAVHRDLDTARRRPQVSAIFVWIVIVDRIFLDNIQAQFLHVVHQPHRAVGAERRNKPYVFVPDAAFPEFLENIRHQFGRPGWPGKVIKKNNHVFLTLGQFGDARRADRVVKRGPDFFIADFRRVLPVHPAGGHVPGVGKLQCQLGVPIPGHLRYVDNHNPTPSFLFTVF